MTNHQTHCCVIHGCKYHHVDCPVVLRLVPGVMCEDCRDDLYSYTHFHVTLSDGSYVVYDTYKEMFAVINNPEADVINVEGHRDSVTLYSFSSTIRIG